MNLAAVFLGGNDGHSDKFYREKANSADLIVAVDSGAEVLRRLNIVPHLLIGDMDSISPETLSWCSSMGTEIKKFLSEKDETDTELAIDELVKRGIKDALLLTATGERPDHFYAILMLLYAFSKKLELKILTEELEIGVVHNEEKSFVVSTKEVWSIFPIGSQIPVVTLKGFKYSITEKEMPFDKPYGVSNISISSSVSIKTSRGAVIYYRWLKREDC
ncbi:MULTISPECIES: thiamine diphosphokinase [Kosmotoga]|uniref:Thiamine diphosphokinase n=1 Tax=Kosmotoga olearia (strain ATCC BAA-1733 / DSM 21960 / TBF 19.5.1) TaxID=521045 RepID=C5CDZ8_KOSOT|nr:MULTISPECIES: thiamine diphosphokinase [Kosmotoga]ACR80100.1 thiamine pyrophosphokinase [Kosmotoga olearia TBF 19.5.1]MDI3523619.1 thiamine pyrophosphokinae [Kosmotoga sp.]MDK2953511.1 thiamine pyrophosphokinae [Kosmotoga sp.]